MFETKEELKREISRMNDRLTTERNLYNALRCGLDESEIRHNYITAALVKKNDEVKSLSTDNKILAEKANEYGHIIDRLNKSNIELLNTRDNLTNANNQLKEELASNNRVFELLNISPITLTEIKSLKEENTQLKEENDYLRRVLNIRKIHINISTVADMDKNQSKQSKEPKIKAYHFKMDADNHCLDSCPHKRIKVSNESKRIGIGSNFCEQCDSNKGFDLNNRWVKCALMPNGKPKTK